MSDVERGIRSEIYRSLALLGADPMLLGAAASWVNGAADEEVLADWRNWNEAKFLEMKEWLPTMDGQELEAVQEQIRNYEASLAELRRAA